MKKFFLVVLAIILAVVVTAIGLQMSGVMDVKQAAINQLKQVPIAKQVVASQEIQEELKTKLEQKEKKIDELTKENKELTSKLQGRDSELEKKQNRIKDLENKEADRQAQQQDRKARIKKLVDMYQAMEPANVARVITELRDELAIEILKQLDAEHAGEILSQLPPTGAAKYSDILSSGS